MHPAAQFYGATAAETESSHRFAEPCSGACTQGSAGCRCAKIITEGHQPGIGKHLCTAQLENAFTQPGRAPMDEGSHQSDTTAYSKTCKHIPAYDDIPRTGYNA